MVGTSESNFWFLERWHYQKLVLIIRTIRRAAYCRSSATGVMFLCLNSDFWPIIGVGNWEISYLFHKGGVPRALTGDYDWYSLWKGLAWSPLPSRVTADWTFNFLEIPHFVNFIIPTDPHLIWCFWHKTSSLLFLRLFSVFWSIIAIGNWDNFYFFRQISSSDQGLVYCFGVKALLLYCNFWDFCGRVHLSHEMREWAGGLHFYKLINTYLCLLDWNK